MAAIEVLAGLPSWGTELTYIQLRNTSCQTRGLYNIGRCMVIVVQYSKTSTRNGHNTLISYVLNVFCQDIIKTVIFVTHPFAKQMSRILYPDRNDITALWHYQLFVKNDRSFTTEDISSILRHASLEAMQVQLGIRDYRQLSICIRRAYCPTLEELIGMREDTNIAAQQAGHSSMTEERIYGISTGYLGKLSKNLVEPYVNTSSKYQILMKVPEKGKDVYSYQYPDKKIWTPLLSPDKSPILRQYAKVEEPLKELFYQSYHNISKNHSQIHNRPLSSNTGLQDLSSISPSSITRLQVDVPDEAVVLDQSNISIEEMNLISQDNSNKLSLFSKVVLFFFLRYDLTNIF